MNPQQWLQNRFPNCRALDENWTFERYDYPENVRQWIRENWIKVSEDSGGTYHEPYYHREKFPHLYTKETVDEIIHIPINKQCDSINVSNAAAISLFAIREFLSTLVY